MTVLRHALHGAREERPVCVLVVAVVLLLATQVAV